MGAVTIIKYLHNYKPKHHDLDISYAVYDSPFSSIYQTAI